MTECIECIYFIKYPNGKVTCLMKHDCCIVKDFTVYPKDCIDFKEGDVE